MPNREEVIEWLTKSLATDQEMLRGYERENRGGSLVESFRSDIGMGQAALDLLAPPPLKLRPMSDAPRHDGLILAYVTLEGTPTPTVMGWDADNGWFCSSLHRRVYAADTPTLIGWLPLPEVNP